MASTFKAFSKQWNFKHVMSSPHYLKSNGQIKRAIQTIKKNIKKSLKGCEESYLALLAIQTSPGLGNNTPPDILFYNHTLRT